MTLEDIKQICQIYDNLRRERDAATIAYSSEDLFWEHVLTVYNLSHPSLPNNLDEATEEYINKALFKWSYDDEDGIEQYVYDAFKAGAEWATNKRKE